MNVVLFTRVSTSTQEYQRQISDLTAFATAKMWKISAIFAEKISGNKKNSEREELLNMLNFIKKHSVDKILVTELSRLGRNTLQILEVVEQLMSLNVSLYIQNYGIETLDDKGNHNPMTSLLITMLAEIARLERINIRERMKSGYDNYLSNGGKVGRKKGYHKTNERMLLQYPQEIKLLKKGISLRNVHSITGTSVNTLRKLKQILKPVTS